MPAEAKKTETDDEWAQILKRAIPKALSTEECAAAEAAEAKEQEARLARRLARQRRDIAHALPPMLQWARFDADPSIVPPRAAFALARNAAARAHSRRLTNEKRVVWAGPPGAGKTILAAFAAVAWAERQNGLGIESTHIGSVGQPLPPSRVMLDRDGRYDVTTPVFTNAYRFGFARIQTKAGTGEAEIVESAMKARLLIIDDLGSERDTANNAVPDILFHRHEEDLPTWVTTGKTKKQIAEMYGGGIARRLFEDETRIVVIGAAIARETE